MLQFVTRRFMTTRLRSPSALKASALLDDEGPKRIPRAHTPARSDMPRPSRRNDPRLVGDAIAEEFADATASEEIVAAEMHSPRLEPRSPRLRSNARAAVAANDTPAAVPPHPQAAQRFPDGARHM